MQSSTLCIISATARTQETKGITGCIFGKSGIGKTSLLHTLPADKTLFIDLEAGDLAVKSWKGDTIRPVTWDDCRNIAAIIGGPNPNLRDGQVYSQKDHTDICRRYSNASEVATKYETIFVDSITVASRLCLQWCKGQPQAFSDKTGKPDIRGAYGLQAQEMLGWLTHLQHTRNKNIWFVGILDEKLDEFSRRTYSPQLEGSKTALELPGIVDEVITMAEIKSASCNATKPIRAFICQTINEYGYPAKDRSGRLSQIEEPHLGKLMAKIKGQATKPTEKQPVAEQLTEAHEFTTAGDAELVTNSTTTTNNEAI